MTTLTLKGSMTVAEVEDLIQKHLKSQGFKATTFTPKIHSGSEGPQWDSYVVNRFEGYSFTLERSE